MHQHAHTDTEQQPKILVRCRIVCACPTVMLGSGTKRHSQGQHMHTDIHQQHSQITVTDGTVDETTPGTPDSMRMRKSHILGVCDSKLRGELQDVSPWVLPVLPEWF